MKLPICVLSIVFGLVSQNGLATPLAPLKVHSGGHYLTTEDGQPFFWLGDTAWELFHRLNREEAVRYLDNRAKLGFNVVQAVAIAELDGVGTPNAYGHLPFDFARGPKDPEPLVKDGPDNDYWDHVDFVVREANARGIYVAMLPTWGRWWKESSVFTPESGRRYCAWLARRYREAGVVWVLGGDRWVDTPEERAIIDAMAAGLREGDGGRHLVTFHPRGGGTSSKCLPDCDWIDFHMRQNGHGIDYPNDPQERYAGTLVEAQRVPAKPVLDGEPVYEGHPVAFKPDANGHTVAADIRRALYWDLFNGAFGHTYGHHSIWQMYDHGRKGVNRPLMTWKEALDEPGAAQLHFAKDLLLSHDFLARIPDPSLIVDDEVKSLVPGVGTRRFVATRDANGSYAFVYAPVGRPFAVDFANLKGERFRSAWMNPRDGTFTPWTAFARPATTRRFTPPTPGELLDWVLVIEKAGLESLQSLAADRGYEITAVDSKPDFVKVAYVLRPSAESFIRCELALPAGREWDGRLWGFGNGGGAGGVHVDVDVARRGSVGVHTDMGTSKGVYGKPEVVRDFGWRATHLMTVSAKELATAYFGRAPSKSYFIGGSTGGGQGFHEALRFPADYDGIISYVPANTRIPLHVYFAWNLRFMKTADGKDVFSAAELSAVEQAAIDWFADKDADYARGKFLTDSRYDAETARAVLGLAKGKCPSLAEGDKLERLHKMLEGPVLGGKRVHAGVPFSASFAAAAGNQWMLQWFLGPDRALHTVTDEELERWLRTWGPDCDACDAGFKAFAARGGKMIVIGGLEDSVVPYPSMIDWYERAAEEMGTLADLEQSCRLYLLPGRAHGQGRGCGGIVGDTQIIVDWVERGVAPFEVKSPLRGGGELSVKPYPHNWTPKAALGCAMRNI